MTIGNAGRSIAVGLVRPDRPGDRADEIRRHATQLGYQYVYTVRPPIDHVDPIGYALGLAAGLDASALVVFDLSTVDNLPQRICDLCDLETVNPGQTWAVARSLPAAQHSHPAGPLTVTEAHAIMQLHKECSTRVCGRKSAAMNYLVRAGKITPPVDTPGDRATSRRLRLPARPRR